MPFMSQVTQMFTQLLKSIDLFGQRPQLRIFHEEKMTSSLGIVCSLGIISTCLLSFVLQLVEITSRTKPSVIMNEILAIESDPIYFTRQNSTLVIAIMDMNLNAVMNAQQIFKIQVENCALNRTQEGDHIVSNQMQDNQIENRCVEYPLHSCNFELDFVTQVQLRAFQSRNLSGFYCPDPDFWDSRPFMIQGSQVAPIYQYVKITILPCKSNCLSDEEISKQAKGLQYVVYTDNNVVQMNNADKPFATNMFVQYSTLSLTQSKQLSQMYQPMIVETDVGLLTQSIQNMTSFQLHNQVLLTDSYNDVWYLTHNIELEQSYELYQRSYPKLQNILSQLGGLYQIMYIIVYSCINIILSNKMVMQLAANLFSFEDYKSYDRQLHIKDDAIIQDGIYSSNNSVDRSGIQRSNRLSKFSPISFEKRPSQYLNLQVAEYLNKFQRFKIIDLIASLRHLFCCSKQERQQFSYAQRKIQRKLDIEFIIGKLIEIEKLKQILLTKDQYNLISYTAKPLIPKTIFEYEEPNNLKNFEKNPAYGCILKEELSKQTLISNAYYSYKLISDSTHKNPTDQRLLQLIDPSLIFLFNTIDTQIPQVQDENNPFKKYITSQQEFTVQDDCISIQQPR